MVTAARLGGTGRPDEGAARVPIAVYDEYEPAQRAVDYLSDQRFPVEHVALVGTDLRLVETVLGRLTTVTAALLGAAAGAWFGLLIGLLFGIFAVSAWAAVVVAGVLIGAVWGAIFGGVSHAVTGGRRDFRSFRSIQADQYALSVDPDYAAEAARQLAQLPGAAGRLLNRPG